METFNLKSNKGITLLALVITIIVLLILAGVTINMIRNDGSTLDKAGEAKTETDKAYEKESIKLAIYDSLLDSLDGYVSTTTLKQKLEPLVISRYSIEGDGPWTVTGKKTGIEYIINRSGLIDNEDNL